MYFLELFLCMFSSRAIPRMDSPLRFAFCTALHLAVCNGVGFLRVGVAVLRTRLVPLRPEVSTGRSVSWLVSGVASLAAHLVPRPLVGRWIMGECVVLLVKSRKDTRTRRRFLRWDVAPLVLHRQAIVQSFKHIHSCSGIGRPVRAGQQLQGAPAVSDRVVPGDSAPVLEAQDPLQTHPFVHCAIGDFRLLRGHLEAFVEA